MHDNGCKASLLNYLLSQWLMRQLQSLSCFAVCGEKLSRAEKIKTLPEIGLNRQVLKGPCLSRRHRSSGQLIGH